MTTPTPPLALPALPELLHCPFCGCKAVWFKTGRDIGIECEDGFDCPGRAQTNVYAPEHRQDVIAEWNRRVDINGNDIRDVAAILSDRAGRGDAAGWVSVEDRLPAVNEKVMFYRAEGLCFGWRVTDTEWTDDSFQDRDGFPVACFGVTHWQPLPAAPTGEPS